jgi:hypothetical protein
MKFLENLSNKQSRKDFVPIKAFPISKKLQKNVPKPVKTFNIKKINAKRFSPP